jgi:diaminopimelate decarboxylase
MQLMNAQSLPQQASLAQALPWSHAIPAQKLRTPAYVYSVDEVARRIRALKAALGTGVVLSFKACPSYDIISRLPADCLEGVELASRGELHMFAGHKPRHFYVNTPAMDDSLARTAPGTCASSVVDAPHQLQLIDKHRGKHPLGPVAMRLSSRLIQRFTPDAPTLRPDQFGMDLETLELALTQAGALGIDVDGLHLFAGPHTFGRAARHVVTALCHVVPLVEERLGHPLRWVSLGGGLEEHWADKGHDFAAYRQELARLPGHLELVHEFGRAIFASAGIFVTKVIATKCVEGQRYAVCDGGMAQAFLLAQTENMLRKYRQPWVADRAAEALPAGGKTIVTGSSCSRDDVIGETLVALEPGDLLVFESCGAYHRTYSMNNFLTLGEASTYVY